MIAGDVDSLGFPPKGFSVVYKDNKDTTGCVSGSPYTLRASWARYNKNIDILIQETSSTSPQCTLFAHF